MERAEWKAFLKYIETASEEELFEAIGSLEIGIRGSFKEPRVVSKAQKLLKKVEEEITARKEANGKKG